MRRVTLRGLAARKLRLSLTALAIVLGVTFVTGTLVLGDTLNRTFNDLIGTAYQHVSFEIRGKATLPRRRHHREQHGEPQAGAGVDRRHRRPPARRRLRPRLGRRLRPVPGAQRRRHRGRRRLHAGLLVRSQPAAVPVPAGGRAARPPRPTTSSWTRRPPTKYHFAVGDRVLMNLPDRAQRFTVTGIVTYGSDDNLAGVTLAGFDLATAQTLFHARGTFDTINVLARPGADNVTLQRAIATAAAGRSRGGQWPDRRQRALHRGGQRAVVHLDRAAHLRRHRAVRRRLHDLQHAVDHRRPAHPRAGAAAPGRRRAAARCSARCWARPPSPGWSRRWSGLGLGVVAALGLKALLKAFGITLPSAPLVFEARTPIVAIAVGVAVTVLSAIVPARRAVRIPPVAALSDHSADVPESLRRWRIAAGAIVARGRRRRRSSPGWPSRAVALVGVGALAVFVAAGMLVPVAARPLSSALGRPLASAAGGPGTARARELDAQPAPDRPDGGGADDRAGAGVDDRRPGRLAEHVGGQRGRQRGQRRLHRHRVRRLQPVRRSRRVAPAGSDHGDHRLPGTVRVPWRARRAWRRRPPRAWRRPSTCTSSPDAARRRWPPASCSSTPTPRARTTSSVGSMVRVSFAQTGPTTMRDRRHLHAQPAGRQLHRRRRVLPLALRQPAAHRRAAAHGAGAAPLDAGARTARSRPTPTSASRPARSSSQTQKQQGQPGARTGLRPAGAGDRRRADRDRQHAHAVGVRTDP